MSDQFVITPGGRRAAKLVQEVAPGTLVHVADGRMRHVTPAGEHVRDVGPMPPHEKGVPLMPANVVQPPVQSPDFGTGWITSADFKSKKPLQSFVTTWVVPAAPATNDKQLLFLFNGLQNSSSILQPVLQWGYNGKFGGAGWCVSCWLADGKGGPGSYSPPVNVNVGDTLTGRMTRSHDLPPPSRSVQWNCEFVGIAKAGISAVVDEEFLDCVETLECYYISRASDYPRAMVTVMSAIAITNKDGTSPALGWTPIDWVTDLGQHTVIVSDSATSGEVQLWYRDDILPGAAVAQGRWRTIGTGHELIPMPDGHVLDWVPLDGTWRLWNYDPASTADVLPGQPVASGKWTSIVTGHVLIPMPDGHVLDWVPVDGTWRLWNYDPASTADVLPGNPVASGKWTSIVAGHLLIPMPDGHHVLDWVPADGTWRLWNYDATSTADVLPGNPVASGKWTSIVTGHTLIVMHDGRVLDWVPADGTWRLWNYDGASITDVLPGQPVDAGYWASINAPQQLIAMPDGKVLAWNPQTGDWSLWTYQP
jgi:hypothetical protein